VESKQIDGLKPECHTWWIVDI